MKVLFFYIDTNSSSGYSIGLGVAALSGYLLKRGVETRIVYFRGDQDLDYSLSAVREFAPDIIGFSATSVGFGSVWQLSTCLRREFPDIFQVVGGVHVTLQPQIIQSVPALDAVCMGYGEIPMLELANRLAASAPVGDISGLWVRNRDSGTITRNAPAAQVTDVDDVLIFDYTGFYREFSRFPAFDPGRQMLDVIFNRGCPFACTFCCNTALSAVRGKGLIYPEPAACIAFIKQALAKTGSACVAIHDDILTLNRKWFRDFIARYTREVKAPFMCNLRIGTFVEADLVLLKQAGLRWAMVGIESGNDYIRNEVMKKGIAPEAIEEAFHLLHKHAIKVTTQNIIGVPFETPEYFLDTVRVNARIKPAGSILSAFYPYPGTELYRIAIEQGLLREDVANARQSSAVVERVDPVFDLPGFPRSLIGFCVRNFDRLIRYARFRDTASWLPQLTRSNLRLCCLLVRCIDAGIWLVRFVPTPIRAFLKKILICA